MNVKTVISWAAKMAEREDLATYLEGTLIDAELEREVEKLLDCYQTVEQDIAMRCQGIVEKEEVNTEDGVIYFRALKKGAIAILRVENEVGAGLPFLRYPDRIETKEGRVFVIYSAFPEFKGLDDVAETPHFLPVAVVAYGVACEYYLMNGLYEEAAIFDKRYKDGLVALCLHSPKRKWEGRKWV